MGFRKRMLHYVYTRNSISKPKKKKPKQKQSWLFYVYNYACVYGFYLANNRNSFAAKLWPLKVFGHCMTTSTCLIRAKQFVVCGCFCVEIYLEFFNSSFNVSLWIWFTFCLCASFSMLSNFVFFFLFTSQLAVDLMVILPCFSFWFGFFVRKKWNNK